MSIEFTVACVLLVWPLVGGAVIAAAVRAPRYRGEHEDG